MVPTSSTCHSTASGEADVECCSRTALYEDIVTNVTLAEQYRQYMIQYLGVEPEDMIPLPEAKIKHDQAGSS